MKTIKPYEGITLEFNEANHRFLVNGEPTVSVTSVTGIIDKSAPLIYWAVGLSRDYLLELLNGGIEIQKGHILEAANQHRAVKEKAGTIGDAVHEFAEQFALGLKPEIPEQENARNGALAFLKWVDESGMKLSNAEQLVYSKKYDYAGIADAEAVKGKKRYVVDFKTSKGIYNEMRYQVSAYLSALQEMNRKNYAGYWILRFDKETGNFDPLFVDAKEALLDFQAFLGALKIKRREQQLKNGK